MTVQPEATVPLIEVRGVTKRYAGVAAVNALDLTILPGEIHALVGENGSGKSTACKLLAGVIRPDEGHLEMDGGRVDFHSPADARKRGVAMVYQEFSLIDSMTVGQNLQLGREPRVFSDQSVNSAAQAVLSELTFPLDPRAVVSTLGSAHKQMAEIAKAVGSGARVIMFDEPTATLTPEDKRQLFYVIEKLRDQGIGILFVSHVLEEALDHADRISVMRDGVLQVTAPASEFTREALVRSMVGRDVQFTRVKRPPLPDTEPALVVRGLSVGNIVRSMSFRVRRGEIVGFAGLVGSGRTETALVVSGALRRNRFGGGRVVIDGRAVRFRTPAAAIRAGVGYITEDRKKNGFFETMNTEQNIYMGWLAKHRGFWTSPKRARKLVERYSTELSVRGNLNGSVKKLSGGNQQKVVIAKTLSADPEIVIFDEPTRGVDVGAIDSIHALIRATADSGKAVVVISSYLPEVLAISDRVLVTKAGQVVAEFDPERATEEDILFAAVH
ncbi:sugar ABC transporter ATP-binding protein [Cryobacterium sp. TMS1-20-1]|uniref:sugar ABC transporter ATP-binding protein n=1 Tax=Cryobacterium sp. TMS1-20-1 TaxID=1259223 RepID=UPI00106B673C|nr:sugar ABC transporter ATP-binding protein [Cryobacterium sp. TMS1-20-1]TFC80533.1 sugar ABC transporter ATP-binding protein [Cryobacterium sp. TMS1-20-1]